MLVNVRSRELARTFIFPSRVALAASAISAIDTNVVNQMVHSGLRLPADNPGSGTRRAISAGGWWRTALMIDASEMTGEWTRWGVWSIDRETDARGCRRAVEIESGKFIHTQFTPGFLEFKRPEREPMPGPNSILDEFTELQVSRQRRYQLRKQAHGLCVICGKRKAISKSLCARCLRKRGVKRPGRNTSVVRA